MADGSSECDIDAERCLAHKAAAQGNIELLVHVVKSDPGVLEQDDGDGYKPLAHAIMMQQLQAVKRLVKMGANINAQDSKGRTGLAVAAYQGWYEGVVYLLRKGAKQNIADKSGRLPLHASTYNKDTRIVAALLKNLSHDAVNYSDNERMTAVQWSCFHNRPQHVQLLLDHGADISVQDVDGKTPLHWAAQNGSSECCRIILLDITGATLVNYKDFSGKCALHYAAAAGNVDVIKLLADVENISIEPEDPDDRTPLHWAAAMGHQDCVSLLLRLGVKPNSIDIDGNTPIDYTRQTGHKACQKLLEERLGIKSSPTHKKEKRKKSKDQPHSLNPFEKLKGLFKKRSNDVKNDDKLLEMKTVHKRESVTSMTLVPKIVLYDHDDNDGKENTGKRKKSKKPHKAHTDFNSPGYFIPSVSPSVPLPPVGSPLLPLSPRLPVQPPESKREEELAPLRVPKHATGKPVVLHDKVAALRSEKEGESRTPTPPPHLKAALGPGRHQSSSPTDFLHKKTKKRLEATVWSQPNDIAPSPRSKGLQSGAGKSQLSPLANQYGQMTTMEKKTLDKTIHSLLQ
ncbi:ankyrin repeat domain-containing protein 55-like isoform X2 [Mytilus californianus]|uniref:ankyrin repeat domain-containing protein 55-like isoform X2 n=1 Tax=Mytilus californianus TaxID=6549 RepID=UPI002246C772|nr:ankyrin repeat domain-containing protein 55-like isoform X2 [Mytilus californianus]